jgi:FixJ family two-component response regulator
MSGYQLLRQLRSTGSNAPVIFITGQEDEVARAMEEGAVACLIKPFSEAALLDGLSKAKLPLPHPHQ